MGESKIEWTEQTWNPIVGCSVVSPGCTNCYAMKMAARLEAMGTERYAGLTQPSKAGPVWAGKLALVEDALTIPLKRRKPTTYFVNSMSDLFHERLSSWQRTLVFAAMAMTYGSTATDENGVGIEYQQRHVYQVLTKRSGVMREFVTNLYKITEGGLDGYLNSEFARASCAVSKAVGHPFWMNAPLTTWMWVNAGMPGLWLGVSCEDQTRADERVPDLLATPAAVRFVSAEPLLGPIEFRELFHGGTLTDALDGMSEVGVVDTGDRFVAINPSYHEHEKLDWIIVGGESGPKARPMHPAWARSIRDQCAAAGVAFHFKQHGAWLHETQGAFYPPASWFDREGKPAGPNWHFWTEGDCGGDASVRVGKSRAGRLLDGVEHNGMPPRSPALAQSPSVSEEG